MHQTIRSTGVHYEERGAGVPVLNLHGWPAEHGQMMAMMEPVFEHVHAGVGSTWTFPAWV